MHKEPYERKREGPPLPRKKLYLQLYLQALLSGMLLVGANSYIAIARKKFVEALGWISDEDLLNYTVIAESVPGGNVCNFFTMVGYKVAGVLGSLLMYIGVITAPVVFMTVVTLFYPYFVDNQIVQTFMRGMAAATCSIIVNVLIDLSRSTAQKQGWKIFGITVVAFAMNYFFGVKTAWLILIGVAASILVSLVIFLKRAR